MAVKKEPTRTYTLDSGIQFKPLSKPKKSTGSKKSGSSKTKQKRS